MSALYNVSLNEAALAIRATAGEITNLIQGDMGWGKSSILKMLAAIGITITLKQVPVVLGAAGSIATIPDSMHRGATLIGLASLAVLLAWKHTPLARFKLIPAALVAVIVATGLAAALGSAARDIREDKDPAFRRSRGLFKALPLWAVRLIIGTMSFSTEVANTNLSATGVTEVLPILMVSAVPASIPRIRQCCVGSSVCERMM
jgi:MFS superfamily sulfate permease-like transporter